MSRAARSGEWIGLVVLGTLSSLAFLAPWVRSGSATRNSFQMFRTAQRLDLDVLTPYRVIWFLVPVVGAAGLVLVMLGHRRSAAVVLFAVGLVIVVVALAVLASPVRAGPGVALGALAGLGHLGFSAWLVRRRRPTRPAATD